MILMHMLSNRNLNWSSSARVLSWLTGVHLAASTIGAIGHGRKDFTADLLPAFAAVLGIDVDDLAILSMIAAPSVTPLLDPAVTDIAELIWDLRRLTIEQVRQVRDEADILVGGD